MKKIIFLVAVGAFVLGIVTSSSKATPSAGRVGSPTMYDAIAVSTDCRELQQQFDAAAVTEKRPGGPPYQTAPGQPFYQVHYGSWHQIGVAYMEAADDRMRAIGCH